MELFARFIDRVCEIALYYESAVCAFSIYVCIYKVYVVCGLHARAHPPRTPPTPPTPTRTSPPCTNDQAPYFLRLSLLVGFRGLLLSLLSYIDFRVRVAWPERGGRLQTPRGRAAAARHVGGAGRGPPLAVSAGTCSAKPPGGNLAFLLF